MDWAMRISLAIVCASGVANCVLIWNNARLLRRLRELDGLLCKLCLQAFVMQSEPIWRAWADCMGAIEVKVMTLRKEWSVGIK